MLFFEKGSTEWNRVRAFFDELQRLAQPEGGFVAIVEVCGFKGLDTKRTRKWLATMPLAPCDRLEMNLLLAQWKVWDEQIETLETEIKKRQAENATGRRGRHDSRLRSLRQPVH